MNVFEEILLLPGAALVLADKLSGRIISRVADGFGQDPALEFMMNLYRAIENKWPQQVLSLREMFDIQLKDASKDIATSQVALDKLTEQQREVWLGEQTRKQSRETKLQAALPKIVDLYAAAEGDTDVWEDLSSINQWSLLNALERGVYNRLQRYKTWAKEDEAKGREVSDAITLRDDANEATQALYELITEFLLDPDIAQALETDTNNGIRVPERLKVA
jgi:hypothetical protein